MNVTGSTSAVSALTDPEVSTAFALENPFTKAALAATGRAAATGLREITAAAFLAATAALFALARLNLAALATFSDRSAATCLLAIDDFFLTFVAGRALLIEVTIFVLRKALTPLDLFEVGFDAFLAVFLRAAMSRYLQTPDLFT